MTYIISIPIILGIPLGAYELSTLGSVWTTNLLSSNKRNKKLLTHEEVACVLKYFNQIVCSHTQLFLEHYKLLFDDHSSQ